MSQVQKTMFIVFSFAVFIPLSIIGIVLMRQTRDELIDQYVSQIKLETKRVNSIFYSLTYYNFLSSANVYDSSEVHDLFSTEEMTSNQKKIYTSLNNKLESLQRRSAAFSEVTIVTDNPNIPTSKHIRFDSNSYGLFWTQKLGDSWVKWAYIERIYDVNPEKRSTLALVRRIGVSSINYHAYAVYFIDKNHLRTILGYTPYKVIIISPDDKVCFASKNSGYKSSVKFPKQAGEQNDVYVKNTLRKDGRLSAYKSFTAYRTVGTFKIRVDDELAGVHLKRIVLIFRLMIICSIAAAVTLVLIFSWMWSRRVINLRNAMRQVHDGNYNLIARQVKSNDELSETFKDLLETADSMRQKEKEAYESKLYEQQLELHEQELENEQQQMEFKMLASQINPHFLYNTLEMIRMQALSKGNREVAKSCKMLGKSLHYVLENTGTDITTLTKELDYVRNYLEIQSLRFGDRVNFEIKTDDGIDTDTCEILPLTIQPIVENAVVHGLESVEENGHITITVMKTDASEDEEKETDSDDDIVICVKDNGPGMDAGELRKLRENISHHDSADTHSIGLYNINRRVKLLYGDNYGLTIDSFPGHGTVVMLYIRKSVKND